MVLGTKKTLNTCMYHERELKDKSPDIRPKVPIQFLLLGVMYSMLFIDPDPFNLGQHFFHHFSLP